MSGELDRSDSIEFIGEIVAQLNIVEEMLNELKQDVKRLQTLLGLWVDKNS